MTKKEPKVAKIKGEALDKHWHLATDDTEIDLAELESTLYRVYAAFERWQSECMAAVANIPLNSTENTVLHVIRMKDRPKTITDIGRFLNRDDIPNLQYAIRKLLSAELIEKSKELKSRGIYYKATTLGQEVTDEYARLRKSQLIPLLENMHHWDSLSDSTTRTLDFLKGIYDTAGLTVSSHRRPIE